MVRAVLNGIDTYTEDTDSLSPKASVTRETRKIVRTLTPVLPRDWPVS